MNQRNRNMKTITVRETINAPLRKVWQYFTQPEHVMNWNFASSDWHCPAATNNLTAGGEFHYTMAAKDGSVSFDFTGTYEGFEKESVIVYFIEDGRKVIVTFEEEHDGVLITETFEPEEVNSMELQKMGWQAILDNFKKYTEA
jgi:uncharacterized protein YndB with AHSA1/START domain